MAGLMESSGLLDKITGMLGNEKKATPQIIVTSSGLMSEPFKEQEKPDYDMEGYIAKYGKPDQSKGQHLTDEFKLPNHITFSVDSKYSTPDNQGGKWVKESGKWHFYASPANLKNYTAEQLIDYFKRVEKDAVLHLPGNN